MNKNSTSPQQTFDDTIDVDGFAANVFVADYGPVAHIVIPVDTPVEQDDEIPYGGSKLLLAVRDFFYEKINKTCIVEFPRASLLIWAEGSRLYVSHSTALELYPVVLALGRVGSEIQEIQ